MIVGESILWRKTAFGCRHRQLHQARLQTGGRVAIEETRGFAVHAKGVPRIARDHQQVTGSPGLDFVADQEGNLAVEFLAIPTLAGSTAYAFAETLGWRQGLDKDLKQARAFYALILLSTGLGVGLNFVDINPVKALYWTAVINGLLAPFLLVAILIVASDRKLMQGQPSSRLGWTVVAITTVAMFAAGVAMFVV